MMSCDDRVHAFMPYPSVTVAHASVGALSGLRFAVKDLFDVAGYPTSGGSPIMLAMSGVKTVTAPTVQRLLDAGACFAGKTVTDELAFSLEGNNVHFGAPVNGAAPERISGGSSSGSASAVSNALVDFALGSDTGGSVRAPASHCGLYGLRPTHGRISLERMLPLAPSCDTCGWFTRDASTLARVADVLLGPDVADVTVRLLWPNDVWALLTSDARASAETAARKIIAAVADVAQVSVALESFGAMSRHFRCIVGHEAWTVDGPLIARYAPPLGARIAQHFAWSRQVNDIQFAAATRFRKAFNEHLHALLGCDGVLLMPTMPDIAPLRNVAECAINDYRYRALPMLSIATLAGVPQLTLPLGGRDGAPIGLSLLGPAGSDRLLVRLAETLAAAGVGR
jgi:amidase